MLKLHTAVLPSCTGTSSLQGSEDRLRLGQVIK